MAETPSRMLPLGTSAPDFSLPDVNSEKLISLQSLQIDKAIVIMFICNHCPYVKHIQTKLVETAKIFSLKGITFVAINSNDVEAYPSDSPEKMRLESEKNGYFFPYLYDESQQVAKDYQAACTPDFYIFDKNKKCIYRGRFDDSTPGNGKPVTGQDLTRGLEAVIDNRPLTVEQKPSVGCNIKWKKSLANAAVK